MELIEKYIDLQRAKQIQLMIEERRESEQDVERGWARFHRHTASTMSVIAGRGTGKTYNLVKRVLDSNEGLIYIATIWDPAILFRELERQLNFGYDYTFVQSTTIGGSIELQLAYNRPNAEVYYDDRFLMALNTIKRIHIIPVSRNGNLDLGFRGRRPDILIFDEPELYDDKVSGILEYVQSPMTIMIGSIRNEKETEFKKFHRRAEFQQVIDNTSYINEYDNKIEFRPSEYRHLFEDEVQYAN